MTRVFEPFPYLHLLTELTELTELTTELNELTELSVLPELTELTELIELTELTELTKNCIYWKSEKVSPTYSLTDNLKSRDASASKKKSSQRKESCKTKRADDRMHKISFHADKICHTGKYGKQPNTKYQMFSEQIISYFSSRKQVTLSSKYDSAHLKIVQNALIH